VTVTSAQTLDWIGELPVSPVSVFGLYNLAEPRAKVQSRMGKHRLLLRAFCYCLLVLGSMALSARAQSSAPNEWTWVGGDNTLLPINGEPSDVGRPGVYGTLGVPAATNNPGARDSAATWTDQNGNFWLFGGFGYDSLNGVGDLNDLWEFNTSTKEWVWLGGNSTLPIPQFPNGAPGVYGTLGTASSGNIPGGRTNAVTWTDIDGNLWLFGGEGYATVNSLTGNIFFNDLWEFKPSTKQWTWMGGDNQTGITNSGQPGVYGTLAVSAASNVPGSRYSAISWTDGAGNLWLFGGEGFDGARYSGSLNDLWEFNTSTTEWTWTGGSSTILPGSGGRPGVYGVLGMPAKANVPGGRAGALSWIDGNGNFWMFGGQGYDSGINDPNNAGYLNDLWEFNPSTTEWTWMGGSSMLPCNDGCGQHGVYGTLGDAAAGNMPGGRANGAHWTDSNGNLWLFGGNGYASTGTTGLLNDLWRFKPSSNQWVWLGGNDTVDVCTTSSQCAWPGVYGTLGVSAAGNIPGSRQSAQSWTDHGGNFWLFGGDGSATGPLADLNDLWSYQPSQSPSSPTGAAPVFSPVGGTYTATQSVTITDATQGALIYYTTDGVTVPTIGSTQYTGPVMVSANETIQAIAVATNYLNSPVASAVYSIQLPAPDFSVAASPMSLTVTGGHSVTTSVSITPLNGFTSAISFGCSGLPAGASCSFAPPTVTPAGSDASTVMLTVTTSSTSTAVRGIFVPLLPGSAAALTFCYFGLKKRRRILILIALSAAGLSLLNGCSRDELASAPQPVTSTIIVTATSGVLQHSTTFTLTVN